jgi:hypothetical protein
MTVAAADVKLIFPTSLSDSVVSAFIATAETIFDNTLGAVGYDATTEDQIVKYLAAHLASMADQRAKSESIGDVSKSYHGQTGMGLDFSSYGQMVKLLDTSKKLVNLGKLGAILEVANMVEDA